MFPGQSEKKSFSIAFPSLTEADCIGSMIREGSFSVSAKAEIVRFSDISGKIKLKNGLNWNLFLKDYWQKRVSRL